MPHYVRLQGLGIYVDPSTCPQQKKIEGVGAVFGHAECSQEYDGSGKDHHNSNQIQRDIDKNLGKNWSENRTSTNAGQDRY